MPGIGSVVRQIVSGVRSTVLGNHQSNRAIVLMMTDKNERAERLEREAQATPSLAEAQALADAADRLRGQAPTRVVRPRLFPAFRN
jgi:hypothetical protein